MLAAICRALDIELSELFQEVTDTLYRDEKLNTRVAVGGAAGPARISAAPSGDSGAQVRSLPTVAA